MSGLARSLKTAYTRRIAEQGIRDVGHGRGDQIRTLDLRDGARDIDLLLHRVGCDDYLLGQQRGLFQDNVNHGLRSDPDRLGGITEE